jgi:hypothetical protein
MVDQLRRKKRAALRHPIWLMMLLGAAVVTAFAISGSAVATTASCSNAATLGGSAFEIDVDANLVVNTSGCIDWLSGGSNTGFRSGVLAKNDTASGANDEAFGQGTSEDDANPTIVTGSIPPNKSDLKAFGLYTETGESTVANPSGKFLALFWSRVQNPSGTTNMDFELNQKVCDTSATPTNCADNGKNASPLTPVRTIGDKLVTYDLSKGGTVPTISIRSWSGSAWGPATVISAGTNPGALGSVNTSTIAASDTGGATGGLTTALGAQDPFTFGEVSLSFQALFGSGCGSFGSAYLKSRSSDSFTAEIKDFVPPERVQINSCPTGIVTSATASVTIGSPISDTATLSGATANAGGTITFNLYGPDDATCSGVSIFTSTVPVNGNGAYNSGNFTPTVVGTYRWTAVYSGDASNQSSTSGCNAANEASVVTKAPTTIATAQTLRPQDSATISATAGGTATGTVTFSLFDNATCTGSPVFTQDRTLSGGTATTDNTTFTISTANAATYKWLVVYSGDANHTGITSTCGTENFVLTINNG